MIQSGMTVQSQDPAESGFLRFYYRNRRPTWFGRLSNQAWAWATGLGLTSPIMATSQVKDCRDSRLRSTVLVPAHYEGERYLVSMLGKGSEWVQNVRAAGGQAFIKRGRSHAITLAEIPPTDRAPILKAWCQVATSGRKHLHVAYDAPLSAFEAIAADYPVFRIEGAGRFGSTPHVLGSEQAEDSALPLRVLKEEANHLPWAFISAFSCLSAVRVPNRSRILAQVLRNVNVLLPRLGGGKLCTNLCLPYVPWPITVNAGN